LKRHGWIEVHLGGFMMYKPIVQGLINFELYCHWKFNKIRTKNSWN
jgi:hypothetical protein